MSAAARVALVTGAASGIGAACARRLAGQGVTVVLADRDPLVRATATQVARETGARTAAVCCDLTEEDDCARMVAVATGEFGRLDIALNVAGVAQVPYTPIARTSLAQWTAVVDGNLTSTFLSLRAELPALCAAGGGAVVNFASTLGAAGSRSGLAAYVAAKHGVVGLTRAAALEYAADGVRVNAVAPGIVETPMTAGWDEAKRRAQLDLHPRGRFASPEEIAALAVFLATDDAGNCTGGLYPADGGFGAR